MFEFNALMVVASPCTQRWRGLVGSVLLGLGQVALAASAQPVMPQFIDLVNYPDQEANWDRFHNLQDHLAAQFHIACKQDGCLRQRLLWPMQLRCSVRVADASVVACIWVIAGSDLRVQSQGAVEPDVRIWRCPLPLPAAGGMDVEAFHAALDTPYPLQVRLPGARFTLMQGLHACLATPGTPS